MNQKFENQNFIVLIKNNEQNACPDQKNMKNHVFHVEHHLGGYLYNICLESKSGFFSMLINFKTADTFFKKYVFLAAIIGLVLIVSTGGNSVYAISKANLADYYNYNNTNGNQVTDYCSGTGSTDCTSPQENIILSSNNLCQLPGLFDTSCGFFHDGQHGVFSPSQPQWISDGSTPYTVNTWINLNGSHGSGAGNFLLSTTIQTQTGSIDSFLNLFNCNCNNTEWIMRNGTGVILDLPTPFNTIPNSNGQWYMLTFTLDPTGGADNAKIYINGVLEATGTTHGGFLAASTAIIWGACCDTTGFTQPLGGSMDETSFWKRVLNQSEVTELYNGGQGLALIPTPPPAPNFTINPISPITVTIGGSASSPVVINSINNFNSPVTFSTSTVSGVSTSFNPASITPPAGGSASSSLGISLQPFVTPSTFTLTVTGSSSSLTHSTPADVTVTVTTSGIINVINQLNSAGCIDSSGIVNALTSKLNSAQSNINAGQIQPAINTLNAVIHEIQTQSGKHILSSCTISSTTFNPATVLALDVQSFIDSLASNITPNPVMGYVVTSGGSGVSGATVSIIDSSSHTVATAITDITGFYYFSTTGILNSGASYTAKVTTYPSGFTTSTPQSQAFVWQGISITLGNLVIS